MRRQRRSGLGAVLRELVTCDVRPEQPPARVPTDGMPAPLRIWRIVAFTADDLCYRLSPGGVLRAVLLWTLRLVTICLIPLAALWLLLGTLQAMIASFSGLLTIIGVVVVLMALAIVATAIRR